ncbi:MAG: Hsp20/alpha crystallin family protein [Cyclobacteriaceae bacterium]|nr:Hsp20/alpha crystallin family protein [Cyclobacteriaceae bacterium]
MKLLKNPLFPSLLTDRWIPEFFENEKFFDSDWMKNVTVPSVNIRETEKEFFVEMAAPGLNKKDFKIAVENGMLTISAEKKLEKEEKEKEFTRKEYSYSNFSRSFMLPENINEEKIEAHYEDGILKLQLLKKAIDKAKLVKAIEVV